MSQIYKDFKYNSESIMELKEICANATHPVGWYEHPYEKGNVRGPWHRWIDVSEDRGDDSEKYVGLHKDDVKFVATAMNHFPGMLSELEKIQQENSLLRECLNELKYGIFHHSHVSKLAEECLAKLEER